jgi:hypothetical protein
MGLETMTTFTSEDREWAYWNNYTCPKYSRQTEIEFFFPLTEQIPLDLEYTRCEPPKLSYTNGDNTGFAFYPTTTGTTWEGVGSIILKATELTIETPNMPWYRKLAFKLLGFKWE